MSNVLVISTAAYEVLQERYELGPMHPAVSVDYPYRDPQDAHVLAEQAGAELAQRGLLDAGDPIGPLLGGLRALARPDLAATAVLAGAAFGDRMFVVAGAGGTGYYAELFGEELHLRPLPQTQPIEHLVGFLPGAPPGKAQPLSVPANAIDADGKPRAVAKPEGVVLESFDSREQRAAGQLSRLLHAGRSVAGQLSLQQRAGSSLRVAPDAVTFYDLPDGRWMLRTRTDNTAAEWVEAMPATAATLAGALHEQRRELQQRAGARRCG